MFINNFKYKIVKAKIIKVVYCHEHLAYGKEYEKDYELYRNTTLDPFNVTSTSYPMQFYDKHDSFDDYRDVIWASYDYKIVIEYCFNNITYKNEIIINNTSHIFKENKTVKVYFDRKNPNNVYIKPIFEL